MRTSSGRQQEHGIVQMGQSRGICVDTLLKHRSIQTTQRASWETYNYIPSGREHQYTTDDKHILCPGACLTPKSVLGVYGKTPTEFLTVAYNSGGKMEGESRNVFEFTQQKTAMYSSTHSGWCYTSTCHQQQIHHFSSNTHDKQANLCANRIQPLDGNQCNGTPVTYATAPTRCLIPQQKTSRPLWTQLAASLVTQSLLDRSALRCASGRGV